MKRITKIQCIIYLILAIIVIPFYSYGADKQIEIKNTKRFPIHITESGSYLLIENIEVVSTDTAYCIQIDAKDVILDLGGHSITGPGKSDNEVTGIYSGTSGGKAVINGTVKNFGRDGIRLAGTYNEVKGIKVYNNGRDGISLGSGVITNCTANDNDGNGIDVGNSSVTNCTANFNGVCGISASGSSLTNCAANENSYCGIDANQSSVMNCTSNRNGNAGDDPAGIWAERSTVNNCTANYNQGVGIIANAYTVITNCTANNNQRHGISASGAIITNSIASANILNAIDANSNCRIEGNHLTGLGTSGGKGLFLKGTDNYAIKNMANDNGEGNFVSGSTTNYMPTNDVVPLDVNANFGF